MKKYLTLLLIFSLMGSLLIGCTTEEPINDEDLTSPEETTIYRNVILFYGEQDNGNFVTEEREISYDKNEDMYKAILEELIKGTNNADYRNNINPETKVYGTIKQNEDIIINFSKEFNQFGGSVAEVIGVGSVVNTLTGLEEINRVKILVEGEELIGPSGNPRGFMDTFAFNDTNFENKEVLLYFANNDATAVKAEKRNISAAKNISEEELIKKVVVELITGPNSPDLYRTIPDGVKIISINIENKIAYVDFSEEMITNHWHGAAGESMTVNSIVNTLTEFNNINLVQMTVEGMPMNIEHMILDEPIGRNEDMIEK